MNELEKKWEEKLRRVGLGIYQPMTDKSEGEFTQPAQHHGDSKHNQDYSRLRTFVDGGELFMDGFEVKAFRSLDREVPEWTLNDKEVQRVLLAASPRLSLTEKNKRNKKRLIKVGRWARLIYLYYRMRLPQQIIVKEMNQPWGTLKAILIRLNRMHKKINAPPPPTAEGQGEEQDEAK